MKHFSAQYIFTNDGPPLKRGIVTADDDGTITGVEDPGRDFKERESVEFHNGIIIPGFVNCHCHLELSYMKDLIPPKKGLAEFLKYFRTGREEGAENILTSISRADNDMYRDGVVLCADICNTRLTFDLKKKSRIKYINLLEVFGIDPEKADRRMNEIRQLSKIAHDYRIPSWIVPHSAYSLSLSLFRLLRTETESNKISSVHFMETECEKSFLKYHDGPILESYKDSGLGLEVLETVEDHAAAILEEITPSGNLILVHNTFADRTTIKKIKKRENLFWCLCPNANLYIEDQVPPLDMLIEENCRIVTGTDSLASNDRLSILEELKTLHTFYPWVALQDLIMWATLNGAMALGEEVEYGSIRPGKKPGLILLQDIDLHKLQLLPESRVTRLL
ncbi:MAG: amidohydrolase family protein [Bacteroidia bacterium]|jgi:cytosine/adenosine deaminase-related metal-dependent hydrolase|nr:amidohydrolase family protein [Bacteroidia bacterium]